MKLAKLLKKCWDNASVIFPNLGPFVGILTLTFFEKSKIFVGIGKKDPLLLQGVLNTAGRKARQHFPPAKIQITCNHGTPYGMLGGVL